MKCEREDCESHEAVPCFLPSIDREDPLDPTADFYYCIEHCQIEGFCYCCGSFWGGITTFDFGNGLCDNCKDEIENEWEEEYENEYYVNPEDYNN